MSIHPLDETLQAAGARFADVRDVRVAADFGDVRAEYTAAATGAAIHDRREQGLIEITGNDRAAWLSNLVTNAVKTLGPGEGNYAFAPSVKGRIQFDLNMLVMADAIWVDLDRRMVEKAMAHFDRYLITEDVRLKDRSADFVRIALLGPQAAEITDALGATHAPAMAALGSTRATLAQKSRPLVRHDFAGVFGVELFVDAADAAACWTRLMEIGRAVNLTPVGRSAVEILRIEAGIPVFGQDIDDTTLPAETQQIERAINYQKGCYLGQEVVERMRAYKSIARKLVGLRLDGDTVPVAPLPLKRQDTEAGRITSACKSIALDAVIALGYVRTAHTAPETELTVDIEPPIRAAVAPLPFRARPQ